MTTCRLTIDGGERRVDLAVPASVPIGELLPELLPHLVAEDEREQPWVLQRLGQEPLDPDGTVETLELRHGDVLYLRPGQHALPAMQFDDVAVGIASVIATGPGRWRPAYTGRLLRGLACLLVAGFVADLAGVSPAWRVPLYLGLGALALGACGVLTARLLADQASGLTAGVAGCVLAALAGLSASRGLAGVLGPGRHDVLLAGLCAGGLAAVLLASALMEREIRGPASQVPATAYGVVLALSAAAVAGPALAIAAHWDAVDAAAVLAVTLFVTSSRGLRLMLWAARLRIPFLPGSSEELQHDVEPEAAGVIARRAGSAVAWLDSVTIGSAAVYAVAFAELLRTPQWIGWALTAAFAAAVLLRARVLTGVWQRACLAACGTLGIVGTLDVLAAGTAGPAVPRPVVAVVLLAAALGLFAITRRSQPVRLPVWGHAADLTETWTAIALLPLLLQLLHVYAALRNLTG